MLWLCLPLPASSLEEFVRMACFYELYGNGFIVSIYRADVGVWRQSIRTCVRQAWSVLMSLSALNLWGWPLRIATFVYIRKKGGKLFQRDIYSETLLYRNALCSSGPLLTHLQDILFLCAMGWELGFHVCRKHCFVVLLFGILFCTCPKVCRHLLFWVSSNILGINRELHPCHSNSLNSTGKILP